MKFMVIILCVLFSSTAFAWDGYDYETGNYVEIEEGNLVRSGQDIEIYDYEDGEYKDVEVESIYDNGSTIEVEIYDSDSGEYRTVEMDK